MVERDLELGCPDSLLWKSLFQHSNRNAVLRVPFCLPSEESSFPHLPLKSSSPIRRNPKQKYIDCAFGVPLW